MGREREGRKEKEEKWGRRREKRERETGEGEGRGEEGRREEDNPLFFYGKKGTKMQLNLILKTKISFEIPNFVSSTSLIF